MAGQTVSISAPDGTSFQCLIVTAKVPSPGLMMFSPIFGPDDDMARIAQQWAARGFVVAVPDYYFRVRPGVLDRSEAGRKAAMERWRALDVEQAVADMACVKAWLLRSPDCNGKVAALGFCAGGELAFLAATRLGMQAAAAYHPTNIERHLDESAKVSVPLSLHFGEADPLVPMDKVALVKQALGRKPDVDIRTYPGAEHGFSFAGRPSYNEAAATGSDRRVQDVFAALR